MKPTHTFEPVDDRWQSLYPLGGASALILLVYSLATMVIMVLTGGQPATVEECFAMLQENRIAGLLRLDLLTVFCMPLYYVLFLAFWAALKRIHFVYAAIATVFVFVGLTLFLATPSVFSYLFLSDRFAAAATDAQRAQLLAAGEAIYASDMWHGTGAMVGGILLQSGALLISVVMLRDKVFGKAAAYVGMATHGLDLAHILVGFLAPEAGVILMAMAGPLYLIWFPLVARRLFQLGRLGGEVLSRPSPVLAAGQEQA